jgi:hypothetical protein
MNITEQDVRALVEAIERHMRGRRTRGRQGGKLAIVN